MLSASEMVYIVPTFEEYPSQGNTAHASNLPRDMRFCITTFPSLFTPWSWNIFFAKSIPNVGHFIATPPSHFVIVDPLWPTLRPFCEGERSIPLEPVPLPGVSHDLKHGD